MVCECTPICWVDDYNLVDKEVIIGNALLIAVWLNQAAEVSCHSLQLVVEEILLHLHLASWTSQRGYLWTDRHGDDMFSDRCSSIPSYCWLIMLSQISQERHRELYLELQWCSNHRWQLSTCCVLFQTLNDLTVKSQKVLS